MKRLLIPLALVWLGLPGSSGASGAAPVATGAQTTPAPPSAMAIAAQLGLPKAVAAAMAGIDAQRIRAHVKFLADDLLEGRGPGVRGGDIAAHYMATQFELLGLKPAGDHGTWYQQVAFSGVQTLPQSTASIEGLPGGTLPLKLADDYVTSNQTQTGDVSIDAPIVFVGYGIDAPEYHWNDYQDVDVKGKVVLVIVNEPPSNDAKFFNGSALTYYGRWVYKFEQAARQGAVGALIIHRTDLASYGWEVVRNSWSNEQVYLREDRDPKLEAASWIALDVARKLFAGAGLDLQAMITAAGERGFRARELPLRFKAHTVSRVRSFESPNVLAMLPGAAANPVQAVLYSAHYDHLGIDPSLKGDPIFNGAVDNATGCGMLLEIARAFAALGHKPPQPVLFAAVTAEEKGLLGSNYLGKHLPLPAREVALGLNFDAIMPEGIPESVNVTGAERTSFYPTVRKTARAFGLEILPDAEPGAGYYYRSDHFSLARQGIPAFSIEEGSKYRGHPIEWGVKLHESYNRENYHQPGDEYRPQMDFTANAMMTRFGLALGWQAMEERTRISWIPGDEFEAARQRSLR